MNTKYARIGSIFVDYLDVMGAEGSCFADAYDACEEKIAVAIDVDQARRDTAHKAWTQISPADISEDPDIPDQPQLLIIGFVCPTVIRHKDEAMRGGYRVVLSSHATVGQFHLFRESHNDQRRSFDKKDDLVSAMDNELMARSSNDLNAKISAFADEAVETG